MLLKIFSYLFQERIYTIIEKNLASSGKIVQKRNQGNNLRFQLVPIKDNDKTKNDTDSGSNNNNNDNKGPLWLAVFLISVLITKYTIFKKYYFLRSNVNSDSKGTESSNKTKIC